MTSQQVRDIFPPGCFDVVVASRDRCSVILSERAYVKWLRNRDWQFVMRDKLEAHFARVVVQAPPHKVNRRPGRTLSDWMRPDYSRSY